MGKLDRVSEPRSKPWVAWALFFALLASVYAFWILPYTQPAKPVEVEFVPPPSK